DDLHSRRRRDRRRFERLEVERHRLLTADLAVAATDEKRRRPVVLLLRLEPQALVAKAACVPRRGAQERRPNAPAAQLGDDFDRGVGDGIPLRAGRAANEAAPGRLALLAREE